MFKANSASVAVAASGASGDPSIIAVAAVLSLIGVSVTAFDLQATERASGQAMCHAIGVSIAFVASVVSEAPFILAALAVIARIGAAALAFNLQAFVRTHQSSSPSLRQPSSSLPRSPLR